MIAACPELASAMGELAHEAGRDEKKPRVRRVGRRRRVVGVLRGARSRGAVRRIRNFKVPTPRGAWRRRTTCRRIWRRSMRGDAAEAPLAGMGSSCDVAVLGRGAEDASRGDWRRISRRARSRWGPRALAQEAAFGEPIATVTAPSSWNAQQKFYVFRRRSWCPGSNPRSPSPSRWSRDDCELLSS